MAGFQPRALHLHSLESLLADLVSGRPVLVRNDAEFMLPDVRTRSALQWYRERGATNWTANVSSQHGEQLVDAISADPPEVPALPSRSSNAKTRRLTLRRLEAHRFAGLHKFGTPSGPPENYVHEFSAALTLFEGRNGSGKTSLANAIIWALTGKILRPQREPEPADADFECVIDAVDGGGTTTYKQTPVTPMPDATDFRPDKNWAPADTWVELTFEDETGKLLPPIRRSQARTAHGKVIETQPDLSVLGVDPISVRIGTLMPGLLPLIRVGSESELGRAVSQLTGLSSLVDLSNHARRAKQKIDKEFVKAKLGERGSVDAAYNEIRDDLENVLKQSPGITPPASVPPASDDASTERILDTISEHLETAKATAFGSARSILGTTFDPGDLSNSSDLEKKIGPALHEVSQPLRLASLARLHGLRQLTTKQLDDVVSKINAILAEAKVLAALAQTPTMAARTRLYARIAAWIAEHPDPDRRDDVCVACGGSISDTVDPVTGKLVKTHIHEAQADAALLSQTLSRWSDAVLGDLTRSLPAALKLELDTDLPSHPCDLLRSALVDELFAHDSFSGALTSLKDETANTFDKVVEKRPPLPPATSISLPSECSNLAIALRRLDRAIGFARWRQSNDSLARVVADQVLGRKLKDGELPEKTSLIGKLLDLEATVKAAKPLSDALTLCGRLQKQIARRRAIEKRLAEYGAASKALENLLTLGDLADDQVQQLRSKLSKEAALWRRRIYLGAFRSTAHELVDTAMGRKGELDLVVRAGGVSAPAQHVTNSSALRASLVAFYLAFWEHVLNERGGLRTIVLDDPQELLDDENRERLADALGALVKIGAQAVVTSYDPRFSGRVARTTGIGGVEHLEVCPATKLHPTLKTIPHRAELSLKRDALKENPDAEVPARDYANSCRIFLEGKLGDLFEDPAFSSWAKEHPLPTLSQFVGRLRQHVNSGPHSMFAAPVFRRFADHPALVDNSPMIQLMNKSHHGRQQEIRPADVMECIDDLDEVVKLAEGMYDECCRWRRRDEDLNEDKVGKKVIALPAALTPMAAPTLKLTVCPDLAAFTQHSSSGASQEPVEPLDPTLLAGKVIFYLRRDNFGFAAPARTLAIVEAEPSAVGDRRLAVCRHGTAVYARRVVRSQGSDLVGLTAETPDPRTRNPKTVFLPESEVAIHQVVGILFEHNISMGPGPEEAVLVDASKALERAEVAFRVADDSAIPLALPKQVVLGGPQIELAKLGHYEERFVALTLSDGSSILKRVGPALPNELAHLRQFESIGGLGSSRLLSIGKTQAGLQAVLHARLIIGVLYRG